MSYDFILSFVFGIRNGHFKWQATVRLGDGLVFYNFKPETKAD
jgi:hypothetical protein